jgi:hypothetical protein
MNQRTGKTIQIEGRLRIKDEATKDVDQSLKEKDDSD